MIKGLLVIGIFVTSMVILFTINVTKSFPNHSPAINLEVDHTISAYRVSEPGLPFNRSQDQNAPVYRAAPSCCAQSSNYFIRLPQHGLNLFQYLFEINTIEKWHIREPSVIRSLRMILYRDIISPNAP